jgi:hypothetical protein
MTNAMLANVEVSPNRVNFCPHANALIDSGRIVADADVWGPAPARIRSPGWPELAGRARSGYAGGSMPIRSFTAARMRCLEPRYRSVV